MNSTEFCYWLQGFFELVGAESTEDKKHVELTSKQVELIKNHLNLVFLHDIDPKATQEVIEKQLQKIHDGLPSFPKSFDHDKKVRC